MGNSSSSDTSELTGSDGVVGCFFGAFFLPVLTIGLCALVAPQIAQLGREAWIGLAAALHGAILGYGTGTTLMRLKEDAYQAGVTAANCGTSVVMFLMYQMSFYYRDVHTQPPNPEHLSPLSIIASNSLTILWIVGLLVGGIILMWKNKAHKS